MSIALTDLEAINLVKEAIKLFGTQSMLAKRANVSQPCLSVTLRRGTLTRRVARALAKAVRRRSATMANAFNVYAESALAAHRRAL